MILTDKITKFKTQRISSKFWKNIVEWIQIAIQKIKNEIDGMIVGIKLFIQQQSEEIKLTARFLFQIGELLGRNNCNKKYFSR